MKKILSSAFIFLGCAQIYSQAQLVKNINTSSSIQSSFPTTFTDVNGITFFVANDNVNGTELWKTNGTAAGTVLVKDIYPGPSGSFPSYLVDINGTLFFAANDGTYGTELWKSDGTNAGTVLVKDVYPGLTSSTLNSFSVFNNALYFSASDGTNGQELWKSDGTTLGTAMLKDINPGSVSSGPSAGIVMGSNFYFAATDATSGSELWKSDGTALGTSQVKDIYAGSNGGAPGYFTVMNNELYFTANDGTNGAELWKSNGSTAGTLLVKDIYAGASGSLPQQLITLNSSTFYFIANDPTNGYELWKSDGTAGNTVLVKDIYPGLNTSNITYITVCGTQIYFEATDGTTGYELWISDGSSAGTALVKDINPGSLNSMAGSIVQKNGNSVYFSASDGTGGPELFRSDGTLGGTVMVKDIYPGVGAGNPFALTNINGTLLFSANTGVNGQELWTSDGTTVGTVLLKNIALDIGNSSPNSFISIPTTNTLFFSAIDSLNGTELWKSDGTTGGTVIVKDICPGTAGSVPTLTIKVADSVYFSANDGTGTSIWKSDGSIAGTVKVKPTGGYNTVMMPNYNLCQSGTNVFFTGNQTGSTGQELWKTNGTDAGTLIVKDAVPGSGSSQPCNLTDVNGLLFFTASVGSGFELYKSNGTTAGTSLVKDINPGGAPSFQIPGPQGKSIMINYNGSLVFMANNGTNGYELWTSNGTSAGTVLVKDIYTGASSASPQNFTISGTMLFFTANDGVNGTELWKTDGTVGGTVLVKDIFPGASSSSPSNLSDVNGVLYFSATDTTNGTELWMSNGTAAGTVRVKDIATGALGSFPTSIANFSNTAFFSANNGTDGMEVWKSNGTISQTTLAADVNAGPGSSSPSNLTAVNSILFFSANDGITGTELWKLNIPPAITDAGTITNVSCYNGNNGAINLTVNGGTQPYNFLWSNGATTQNISALVADTFSVIITDNWGWTEFDTFIVTQPPVLTVTLSSKTDITCFGGNNGAINISVGGGTPNYTYAWSPGGATTQNVSGLTANTYTVVVTDANSCAKTFSVTLTQPPALAGSTTVSDATCMGGSNGSVSVSMTAGASPFTYQWSVNAGSQTTQTATALAQGTYSVVVTDNNLCTKSFTATVNQPSSVVAPQICMVAVDTASTHNIIYWDSTGFANVDTFLIQREVSTNVYSTVGKVANGLAPEYHDMTANPNGNTYRYKLGMIDTCGNRFDTLSYYHNTVYQTQTNGTFSWAGTEYKIENVATPVSYYVLERDSLSNGIWDSINSCPGTQFVMTDANWINQATARWRITTRWGISCDALYKINPSAMTFVNTSRSNIKHQLAVSAGINKFSFSEISIYPNPTKNEITINCGEKIKTIELENILGQIVFAECGSSNNSNQRTISLSHLSSGIYFVNVITDGGKRIVKKVVKE